MANEFIIKTMKRISRRVKYTLSLKALLWSYRKKHDPRKAIIAKLGSNLKVRLYPHDVIGKHIYIDGYFESSSWNFVSNFLKPGMTVFDLGANLGQYTLLSGNKVGESGQIHSFEPSERMFKELSFNVKLNGLHDRCLLNNVAISDSRGTAKLTKYEPGNEVYGSLGSHTREESEIVGYDEVKTIKLDDYISEMNVKRVDFMKIDIEGAELLALKGAKCLLDRDDSPVILLELADINTVGFGYKALETWHYLESFGYKMHSIDENGDLTGELMPPSDFVNAQDVVAIKAR